MSRFIVFDVETPNRHNDRMSAIGITVVDDGIITEELYSLVDPETYFDYFNVKLTGINEKVVADAPNFPKLWEQIEPIMSSGLLVAHNAVFDMNVLKRCLRDYEIEWRPYSRYICTVQIGRSELPGMKHGLDAMCEFYGIALDHHKADSDSHAAAEILLRYMEDGVVVEKYVRTFWMR